MKKENSTYERKSIRYIENDLKNIAKDCVAFANARGGTIDVGIEDKSDLPPAGQSIDNQTI